MSLGNNLFHARKKAACRRKKLLKSWESADRRSPNGRTDETLPDIRQSKHLSALYHLTLDELIDYDMDVKEIERLIENTSEEAGQKIDWTNVWGKKYPVLTTYQERVDVGDYADRIKELLDSLKTRYGYNDLDAMLAPKIF